MLTPNEISEGIPLIYAIAPYQLNSEGGIEWLGGTSTPTVYRARDQEAYDEAQRKITLLSRSVGFVDLTKVDTVCRVGSISDEGYGVDSANDHMHSDHDDAISVVEDDDKCFEIVLDNGLRLKLQV